MRYRRPLKENASETLKKGAAIYAERNKTYGDSFIVVGHVMAAMFPNGINLKTEEDFRRFHLYEWMVGKMVRYSQTFEDGGHTDSIEDAVVYGAMLAFEDHVIARGEELPLAEKSDG